MRAVIFLALFSLFTTSIIAQTPTAQEIADKTSERYKYLGDDCITIANMDLRDSKGKTMMERDLLLIRKNVKGSLKQKWYAYFKKPADIRKMVFLALTNPEGDDDRWIFLPAMDLVKRLAGSDKRSSFAGSQFVYEDVTGRNPKIDNHELINSQGEYYEVKSIPKNDKGMEFSYYMTWSDKTHFVPVRRVFYNSQGKAVKEFKSEKTENIQGFETVTEFSMTDLITGESTYTIYTDLKYNVGIDDKLFTESQIRRSPRKWLKYNK